MRWCGVLFAASLCLAEDEGKAVWIGTRTSGLHLVRPLLVSALVLSEAPSGALVPSSIASKYSR